MKTYYGIASMILVTGKVYYALNSVSSNSIPEDICYSSSCYDVRINWFSTEEERNSHASGIIAEEGAWTLWCSIAAMVPAKQ